MKRLTVPAERLTDGGTRIQVVDARAVREHAMELYWQLKKYEDTGLSPDDVTDLMSSHAVAIGELAKMPKWIPVTERFPEPLSRRNDYKGKRMTSETVLCVCVQNGGKRMVKEGRCEFYGGTPVWRIPGTIDSVTHWMPMPKPPKEVPVDA